MKKTERTMEEWFDTLPETPEDFFDFCFSEFAKIPIFYKRKGRETEGLFERGRYAECLCGKCGKMFQVNYHPTRNEKAECPHCGNKSYFEWTSVTKERYENRIMFLVQKTTEENIVIRIFDNDQSFKYGRAANQCLNETHRLFLELGKTYRFENRYSWTSQGWRRTWTQTTDRTKIPCTGNIYYNYKAEVQQSNLKYCNIEQIQEASNWRPAYYANKGTYIADILIAFANNPAIEMYTKAGMNVLVRKLVQNQGRCVLINRKGKSVNSQLRLKRKQHIQKLIQQKGNLRLLEILQMQERLQTEWTEAQIDFLVTHYPKKKEIFYLLKYMSFTQLLNRIEQYGKGEKKHTADEVIGTYFDYLKMREELGYDMKNEVYLHPKNLIEKHNQMVVEVNAKRDKEYCGKQNKKYIQIAKKYQELCKKYEYSHDGYIIRPAKNAAEIVMEGRLLHHCVGRDWYLEKHNSGTSYILLLRKEETPETPYYTIEIQKNKILQWYGIRDSKPDKEVIEPWLDKYVEHLEKSSGKKALQAVG